MFGASKCWSTEGISFFYQNNMPQFDNQTHSAQMKYERLQAKWLAKHINVGLVLVSISRMWN